MTVGKREEYIWQEGVWVVEAAEVHTVDAQKDLMIHIQTRSFRDGKVQVPLKTRIRLETGR